MFSMYLIIFLACTCTTSAVGMVSAGLSEKPSVMSVLGSSQSLSMFSSLMRQLVPEEDLEAAPLTVLAPTNQAIKVFCTDMGLTVEQLQQRPELVDTLLSYHILPKIKADQQIIAKRVSVSPQEPTLARTVNPGYKIRLFQLAAAGSPRISSSSSKNSSSSSSSSKTLYVRDVQNNTAVVKLPGLDAGKSVIYVIDRVLLNGDVFTSPAAAMTYYKRFSKISKLLASTGLWPQLSTPFFNNTIFAPRNSVLKAAESRIKGLGEEGLTNALKYHVVPGDRPIPRGFVAGQVYATLLTGSGLSIKYNETVVEEPAKKGKRVKLVTAMVVPEQGSPSGPATITLHNIFAGQAIINGIDGVLLPKPSTVTSKPQSATKGAVTLPSSAHPASSAADSSKPAAQPSSAPSATKHNSLALGQGPGSVAVSLPLLFGKPGLIVRLDLKGHHHHHLRRLTWDMIGDRMSRDQPDAGRGRDRAFNGRRITGMDRGGGSYRGFSGGGGFSSSFDDRRDDASAYRVPSYTPPAAPIPDRSDFNTDRSDNTPGGTVYNNDRTVIDTGPTYDGENDRGQSNTAYGLRTGPVDDNAREPNAAWTKGYGGYGGVPYGGEPGMSYGGDYEPAPVPVPAPAPVPVNDYSDNAAVPADVPTAVYVPVPTPVQAPVPVTDYNPVPVPVPQPVYVPNPVPNPVYVPQPVPSTDYVPTPVPNPVPNPVMVPNPVLVPNPVPVYIPQQAPAGASIPAPVPAAAETPPAQSTDYSLPVPGATVNTLQGQVPGAAGGCLNCGPTVAPTSYGGAAVPGQSGQPGQPGPFAPYGGTAGPGQQGPAVAAAVSSIPAAGAAPTVAGNPAGSGTTGALSDELLSQMEAGR